ncbi:MAG: hypothetical protein R3B45_04015 [Bdellovibrionota bacterium]
MAGSLADALKKAGLSSSENEYDKRSGRKKKPVKGKTTKTHDHHHRTDCELCRKTAPDVERYNHTNRSIDASWLCIPCADRLSIPDECRQTNQSDFAMRKMFTRQFGRTKQF